MSIATKPRLVSRRTPRELAQEVADTFGEAAVLASQASVWERCNADEVFQPGGVNGAK